MNELLWFDDTQTPLVAKIQRGADYFASKHGRLPTRCTMANADILQNGGFPNVPGIRVVGSNHVETKFFLFTVTEQVPEVVA